MRRTSFVFLAALSGVACLLGGAALAQQQSRTGLKLDGNKPIQIESDKLEVRDNDRMAIFTGNVNVVQDTLTMKAGKMTVYYVNNGGGNANGGTANGAASVATGASEIDHIDVSDKVYVKSQTQVATGDSGTFDMKSQMLTMSGKEVVLSEGKNVLTGCKLTVRMDSGQATLDGCSNGGGSGRVKVLLQPGSEPGQAATR